MEQFNALAIGGGSTKIAFLAGVASRLLKEKEYKYFSGISAGSITSLMIALEDIDVLKNAILGIEPSSFFKHCPPLDQEDNITLYSKIRLLLGKDSLGVFDLKSLLKKYHTPQRHELLQNSDKKVLIGACNLNLKKVEWKDIAHHNTSYEEALDWVVASSSIPIATSPVKIGDYYYLDGGIRTNMGGRILLQQEKLPTHLDMIFSRTNDYDVKKSDYDWEPKNILDITLRVMNIMAYDVSFEDEKASIEDAKNKNVNYDLYFPPYTLTEYTYKIDKDLSLAWWNLGIDAVEEKLQNNN